jgi:RNA polymerase sigma factor (sigma-70 family)
MTSNVSKDERREELLEQFLRDQWQPLVRCADQLMGAPLRATASPEDVLQEACKKAFRSIHRFLPGDDPIASLTKWFDRILQRAAADMARKNLGTHRKNRAAVLRLESDLLLVKKPSDATPSRNAANKEARRAIEAALGQLPKATRRIIELYYWGGLTTAEIADRLKLASPQAAEMRLHRARRKLRKFLGTSSAYFLPPR